MLNDLHSQEGQPSPYMQLLQLISAVSRAQQQSHLEHHVHWSRLLLAHIRKVTGAQLLVGASAMTYNQRFQFFVSPNSIDRQLCARHRPQEPALLNWTHLRLPPLRQAAAHALEVWILQKTMMKAADADSSDLLHLRAQQCVELPGKSRVVHNDGCWEEAQWNTFPAYSKIQLWHTSWPPTWSTTWQPVQVS